MPSQCKKLKQECQNIETLKEEFSLELEKAITKAKTPEQAKQAFQKAKELKEELEQKRDALSAKLWTFENLHQKELEEQYESQKEILQRVGLLEKLSTGEMGIKAIDNKEYVFPTYQEIAKRIRENKEMLKTKIEQGFNQLLIVPFGMKLDDLIEKYKQIILKHHKEGKLLATKEKPTDPDEPLELDENQPVWVWEGYKNADTENKIVYFPQEFSQNHQGKTKQELLKEQGGFNVLFIEDLPNIPRKGKGKTIGSPSTKLGARKQLEAGLTPNDYLKTLKINPIYQNESGMTPEEQIIYAIRHLEQTSQVIDDYSGKGSVSYQIGAYFKVSGNVPGAGWSRDYRRAHLGGNVSGYSDSGNGVRARVRVL